MRASSTTTLVEPTANRRQPVRQTRVNSARAANASRTNGPADERPKDAPGFFPGITHFTDTITALPKEMIRHYTMLKEVDVKIFAPEEHLKKLMATIPPRPPPDDDAADFARRQHFHHARLAMSEMLPSLDEKNHAITMANDNLTALLGRLDSAWPQVEREISEEARWGSLNHWAYHDKTADKKNTVATERTRREVALANSLAAAAAGDADAGPSRADTRGKSRKALAQAQQQHADSEHEDPRPGKKAAASNKRSKPSDFAATNGGAAPATANGNKRRRVEKPNANHAAAAAPMEKSLSAVFGAGARGGASPRETPAAESSRKKGRAGQASTNASGRRRFVTLSGCDYPNADMLRDRAGTVNSNVNSPNPASSPIVGTFSSAAKRANSPAVGTAMQRTSSARLRQSSNQAPATNKPLPAAAEHNNTTVGLGLVGGDERPLTANSTSDAKTAKTDGHAAAETDVRTSGRATAMKREDSSSSRAHRPPSISTATRNNPGKASKTGTPVAPSFADAAEPSGTVSAGSGSGNGATHPPRSARATAATSANATNNHPTAPGSSGGTTAPGSSHPPAKRSHKKGAGLQAQLAAAHAAAAAKKGGAAPAPAPEDDASSEPGDEDDADTGLRYCYCNGPSYGPMVACDMAGCEREWFHLECVGLTKPPNSKSEFLPYPPPGLSAGCLYGVVY